MINDTVSVALIMYSVERTHVMTVSLHISKSFFIFQSPGQ